MANTRDYPPIERVRKGLKHKLIFDGASRPNLEHYAYKIGFGLQFFRNSPSIETSEDESIRGTDREFPQLFNVTKFSKNFHRIPLLTAHDKTVELSAVHIGPPFNLYINPIQINTDGDEAWYVYRGTGVVDTIVGTLCYKEKEFIYIPRSFLYVLRPFTDTFLVGIESAKPLLKPSFSSFLNEEIPWSFQSLQTPQLLDVTGIYKTRNWEIHIKRNGKFIVVPHKDSPFSCLGYRGTPYPFVLPVENINIPTADALHTDPTACMTLVTDDLSVGVSTLKARRTHSLPYSHINHYDECLFYAGDNYEARGDIVKPGHMTYHPQGFLHGPQPESFAAWHSGPTQDPKDNPWTNQLAIMFESKAKLSPTGDALYCAIPDYWESWNRT